MKSRLDKGLFLALLPFIIYGVAITGEIKCIVKAVKCDWEPIGKAEIIYTASAVTGIGSIVGWINIEDN